jgi:hypothetical protein
MISVVKPAAGLSLAPKVPGEKFFSGHHLLRKKDAMFRRTKPRRLLRLKPRMGCIKAPGIVAALLQTGNPGKQQIFAHGRHLVNSFWWTKYLAGLCTLAVAPLAVAGQGLCQNSPELPSAILGLVGGAAAAYPVMRERARSLLKRRDRAAKSEE